MGISYFGWHSYPCELCIMKVKKQIRKGFLTAKLTFFDWGWADNVIYRVIGKTNEKDKGLLMIDKIKQFFGIRNNDIEDSETKRIKDEIKRINWTRDEKGQIISPFDKKKNG
ncbi:hypothetical protein LCGC14_0546240 [marine sediment metagenome]|uniref:Uncharacterized protein n=1 Tax=marine sediment metagenome TaxID=412755 RepID=A0A0F9RW84_9ZZZZ